MALDTVAMVAVSVDGYLAADDGSVEFLERYPIADFDFDAFLAEVGAIVTGSTSYLQAVGWGWPFPQIPTVVLTTQPDLPVPNGAAVRFEAGPTSDVIDAARAITDKRVWVFGGGNVITAGVLGGAVDRVDLTVMPEALGSGVPLFTAPVVGRLALEDTHVYANGAVRLVYRVR